MAMIAAVGATVAVLKLYPVPQSIETDFRPVPIETSPVQLENYTQTERLMSSANIIDLIGEPDHLVGSNFTLMVYEYEYVDAFSINRKGLLVVHMGSTDRMSYITIQEGEQIVHKHP